MRAWGSNEHGRLGDGTRRDSPVPVEVRGLDRVTAISASVTHSLALREDGSVWAWGENRRAELGDGTQKHRRAPVPVRDLDAGVTAISAGDHTSLALREDGSVVGWGLSVVPDRLGADDLPDRPMPVPGLGAGVVAIAHGSYSLALMAEGSVRAWGIALGGVSFLAANDLLARMTPQPVSELEGGVTAIAASTSHCLALMADGSVVAWGRTPTERSATARPRRGRRRWR